MDHRDQILLENLTFQCQIGALPFEQARRQPISLDLVLYCHPLAACLTDRLDQTISYADVYETVRLIAEQSSYKLIERLAGAISDELFAQFELLEAAEVTIHKPQAPIAGFFKAMGIRIYRERPDDPSPRV